MGSIIIYSDIICTLFLFVLVCGCLLGSSAKDKSTVYFRICLIIAFVGTICDSICYVTVDPSQSAMPMLVADLISFILCAVLLTVFALYMFSIIETRATVPRWGIYPILAITIIDTVMLVIGTINGELIYTENGEVMEGAWADYPSILGFLGILFLYYVLVCYRKALSNVQFFAFGVFLFFPLVDSWITLFNTDLDFTYALIALSFLVIYVIIQENAVAEESIRKKIFEEDDHIDPQTGFRNRHAYDEVMKAEERGRANGVVYCNVEELDAIREKSGPEAVDKRVVEFYSLFKDSFPGAKIYRTLENVFVAVLYGISEDSLKKKTDSFKEVMEHNGGMASFGYAYSDTDLLFDMVRNAQQNMI